MKQNDDSHSPALFGLRPISVRVREACRLTGIGRSKLYELIGAGEIEVFKVGTSTLIPMERLEAFITKHREKG